MTKAFFWEGHTKHTFEIPFRCFLPQKINNMILTGAPCHSAIRYCSWSCAISVVHATEEITGYAATSCIDKRIGPKELAWSGPYV
jgi:hypothetical protein